MVASVEVEIYHVLEWPQNNIAGTEDLMSNIV